MVNIMENTTGIKRNKLLKVLLLAAELLIAAVCLWLIFNRDTGGPVIQIDPSVQALYSADNQESLLNGVTAYDEKDGDVTDSIIIKGIIERTDGKVLVSYAAKDKDNNVTVETRLMDKGTEEETQVQNANEEAPLGEIPVIILKTNEVTIKAGSPFSPIDYVEQAIDDKDDAWKRIQVTGSYDINSVGTYTITYMVTDSDGNSSEPVSLILTVEN